MPRLARLPRIFPLLALALLAEGFSYLGLRLLTPYDNARLEPGQNAWLTEGVEVSPLAEEAGGLRSGDVVIAVEGRPMREWGQALFQPAVSRPALQASETVPYTLIRGGQRLTVQIQPGAFPLRALLSLHWGVYAFLLGLQGIMTYVLLRRPEEEAARALFVFAWSTWHALSWTTGLHASDIVSGSGYWLYRAATFPNFLLTFSAILHTTLVFPKRIPILDRYPRLISVVYLAPYGLFILYMATMRLFSANLWDWLGHWNAGEWAVAAIYVTFAVIAAIGNYRASHDIATRLKTRWAISGLMATAASLFFLWLLPGALMGQTLVPTSMLPLLALPLPLGLAIAILRYRLFDIDIILNRTLVYGALTAITMGIYVFIVGYVGDVLQARDRSIIAFLATGIVAVTFQPLRARIQRLVNRWMYGDRDDPYAVLSRLSQRLESTLAPNSILPAIVETVAGALKLPYAAITLRDADADRVAAAFGLPTANTVVLPLAHQHELIGHLHVAQRSADEPFTPAERRLLEDIARQIGVAAHNVRLTADLQRSRERLVTTREEERRRLRRDLHDGLGPTLASQSYKLDAVLDLMDSDPATARKLVSDLKSQAQTTLADIRRLIYELRPPALDELGLAAALQAQFTDSANGLRISVESPPDGLPPLSAAVEVAAYRIAMEAVNNATRHARARHCVIRFGAKADELTVEITDDGTGLQGGMRAGVGLTSMRERAAELGGQCVIDSSPKRGTRVCAILPLAKEAP